MEAGGGEETCEEEQDTLQTAFKKLRVDAESLPATVSVCEALTSRPGGRGGPDGSGAKSKLSCPKDTWHGGCMRKTLSRGAARSQRRRRSKSPILHPPKFTYCSSSSAGPRASPPPGHLKKHRSLPDAPGAETTSPSAAKKEMLSGPSSSPVFGGAGYEHQTTAASLESHAPSPTSSPREGGAPSHRLPPSEEESVPEAERDTRAGRGRRSHGGGAGGGGGAASSSDFRSLSQLQAEGRAACPCGPRGGEGPEGCGCPGGWRGLEVYSFTGLRDAGERSLARPGETGGTTAVTTSSSPSSSSSQPPLLQRTHTAGAPPPTAPPSSTATSSSSGSPRSCSEQARAYVDDITIEDLSGYMEYYLYIPKKMSHMAEMMYT